MKIYTFDSSCQSTQMKCMTSTSLLSNDDDILHIVLFLSSLSEVDVKRYFKEERLCCQVIDPPLQS